MHILPRSFRLVCAKNLVPGVEALLRAEGFDFAPEPFFAQARTLTKEPFALGKSLAACFGYLYIQDKSSMLPPLALAPKPGQRILDLCASPGSKSGLLADLVGPQGLVLANEPNPERLATLRANLRHLGCVNVVTCKYQGQDLPLGPGSCPAILLDAPCSGWGTVDKHPKVAQIWSGSKTAPLEALQRELLTAAAHLLAPGGRLIYSTCTTNERENEAQVRFAQDHLGLVLEPLPLFAGFDFAPSLSGCLLVDGQKSAAQGFFLACLRKPGTEPQQPDHSGQEKPGIMVSATNFAAQTGLDTRHLPPHQFLAVSGRVHVLLDQALAWLPPLLRWQGFVVGKMAKDSIVPDPTLRFFLPPQPEARALVLEQVAEVRDLLSGQSRSCPGGARRLPLYFRDLPLGFLTVKGSRCLWSSR